MRTLFAILAAFWSMGAVALAPAMKQRAIIIRTAPHLQEVGTIVIPAGSPLRLVSALSPQADIQAAFRGRFTLSGAYKVEGYGEDTSLTIWPDRASREALPHWQDREVPEEMDISNAWAFARAALPNDKLQELKTGRMKSARGHVTIIADRYETSIDCDVVAASARFVSVVKKVQIAAVPAEEEGC
jgi:hypothetical protein